MSEGHAKESYTVTVSGENRTPTLYAPRSVLWPIDNEFTLIVLIIAELAWGTGRADISKQISVQLANS